MSCQVCITQNVEVEEKSVFNNIMPFKSSVWGSESFGGSVVEIKGRVGGVEPFLEGFSYVLAKCIPQIMKDNLKQIREWQATHLSVTYSSL